MLHDNLTRQIITTLEHDAVRLDFAAKRMVGTSPTCREVAEDLKRIAAELAHALPPA